MLKPEHRFENPPLKANEMTIPDALTRLEKAINSHDPRSIAACFSVDYVSEIPHHPARSFEGRDSVLRSWEATLSQIPDLTARVLRSAADGDDVWSEWLMEGTAADGSPATIVGPVIWRTDTQGLVAWARFYLHPVTEEPVSPV
jgi:hypothetical protein